MIADDVICRCTRDGKVLWGHVATQLGQSIDTVRAAYDPTYMRAYSWASTRPPIAEPRPETESNPNNLKAPLIRTGILARLRMGSASAETIAAFLAKPIGSVQNTLATLRKENLVDYMDRAPRMWFVAGDHRTPQSLTLAEQFSAAPGSLQIGVYNGNRARRRA